MMTNKFDERDAMMKLRARVAGLAYQLASGLLVTQVVYNYIDRFKACTLLM